MAEVLLCAGVLCLLSFVILCFRKVDFCRVWLYLAVLFGCWGGYLFYRVKNPAGYHLPDFFVAIYLILFLVLLGSFLFAEYKIIGAMLRKPEQTAEYIIVLGAQVKKRTVSKALRLRLDKAAQYMIEHKNVYAVLSGGQGDGEEISEAACMYQYLLDKGVEDERLLLEDMSTTTKENLELSVPVIERSLKLRGCSQRDGKACPVALVSNNFHIYRAVRLAKKLGYQQVEGIPAHGDLKLQIHYMIREYFALLDAIRKGDI